MTGPENPAVSIVLNDMDRTQLAVYGFRSWMLQDFERPYEVVLVLLNARAPEFERLTVGRNPRCSVKIRSYAPPTSFNISATNNLGLHHASGRYVFFANSDIVYPSNYLRAVAGDLESHSIACATGMRIDLGAKETRTLPPVQAVREPGDFDYLAASPGRERLGFSPWMVLSDVAREVGGFDPRIRCFEDADFNERVMHLLQRRGMQQCLMVLLGIAGYHLHHPYSELYSFSDSAQDTRAERRRKLKNPQDEEASRLPTQLESIDALLDDLYSVEVALNPPSRRQQIRMRLRRHGVVRRVVRAGRILFGENDV